MTEVGPGNSMNVCSAIEIYSMTKAYYICQYIEWFCNRYWEVDGSIVRDMGFKVRLLNMYEVTTTIYVPVYWRKLTMECSLA